MTGVGLLHPDRDHEPGNGRDGGDGPDRASNPDQVGEDAAEQRPDGEAEVAQRR
jgi:hypothetical protein